MQSFTSFSREAFTAFREAARPGPVQMLNLVRLHERARYPDEREASGADAFAAYGRISAPVLARLGGRILWRGDFEQALIGPGGQRWDVCFIAEYPSVEAFAALFRDPTYREAMAHRQAAVRDCRLLRFGATEAGAGFAG
ncbi:DUF1330 domain-containing protein [Bosea rubneri]|uniref:DUF1330 domain-containing protein n=1 Tax=Bosea rubneri TaxID=3075434 RepID=A0ABU3SFJ5_9HYPH|nr:DUF1330 domain-containing protein [Bosea sp. ZW T0_25]MDU0343547.1 DUF1330 domain-containing protein [Bosea sp. ZW T0_25]